MSDNESTSSSDSTSSNESIIGWCEIEKGDKLGEYTVINKLGKGRFSSVWKCEKDNNLYALKVQRDINIHKYYDIGNSEIKLYEKMNGPLENVLEYHGNFVHHGGSTKHQCLIFEAMDTDLMKLIENDEGITLTMIKDIIRQLLTGLKNLHEMGIIHTDLKPENILVKWNEDKTVRIAIGDLGAGCEVSDKEPYRTGTTEYRSPEAILETKFSPATDIWSLACIIFEMITGDYLFDPHNYLDDEENLCGKHLTAESEEDEDYILEHMHLHTMIAILGEIPRRVTKSSEEFKEHFHKDGTIRDKKIDPTSIKEILIEDFELKEQLASEIEDFLLPMLKYRQHERSTAAQLLEHPFLKK